MCFMKVQGKSATYLFEMRYPIAMYRRSLQFTGQEEEPYVSVSPKCQLSHSSNI